MNIINSVNTPSFGAKFLYSKSLNDLAKNAVSMGIYDDLYRAKNNIDQAYLRTRIKLDIGMTTDGYPCAIFTTYEPKPRLAEHKCEDDYKISVPKVYVSDKKGESMYKFALRKLVEMGNNAPNNKMFKEVVAIFS